MKGFTYYDRRCAEKHALCPGLPPDENGRTRPCGDHNKTRTKLCGKCKFKAYEEGNQNGAGGGNEEEDEEVEAESEEQPEKKQKRE